MKINLLKTTTWNYMLLGSVIITAFIIPCFPSSREETLFKVGYTLIFISATFSLDRHKQLIFIVLIVALILEWISSVFDLKCVFILSKAIKMLFFSFIVFSLIKHLINSKRVNSRVIVESISGYILLGIVYAMIISFIMNSDPLAFNIAQTTPAPSQGSHLSEPLYFGFVTMSTLGYGDIVPLKAYSRSLATWISISGQLYIAIIVALLVGKFASGNHDKP